MHRRVGLLASKNERVGAILSDPFTVLNAWSWLADHMKSFFVLRTGRSGAKCMATASVLAESGALYDWLALGTGRLPR